MKFTLTYDGPLGSQNSGNKFEKKWEIRKFLDPQLQELWRTHPTLKTMPKVVPFGAYKATELHHSRDKDAAIMVEHKSVLNPASEIPIRLSAPIEIGGVKFLPLVRDTYALVCSLDILFLRKEPAGRVYHGGDLDNRLKVFLDALKVPKSEADCVARLSEKPLGPIHCVMEDDSLITSLEVRSSRLLTAPDKPENWVRLVVDVNVTVTHPRTYNLQFLGD